MRHQVLRKIAIVLTALLVTGVLTTAGTSPATAAKPKPKPVFTPAAGPTFNNPYGSVDSRRAIIRKILRTIDVVPRGEEIRIASWNVRSSNITAALLRAHKRGVSVQVVMDRSNWTTDNPNPDASRLAHGLKAGKVRKKPENRSWLRECRGSCRGPHGIAHTKFFLFSKAGHARNVVIFGSNNATELAAEIQWNDIYTRVERPNEYAEFLSVFNEMRRDERPKGGGYREFAHTNYTTMFYPYYGKDVPKGDPVLTMLNRVRCTGATGGTGTRGRTRIRIAQTAMYGDRGIAIANRLATMHRRGCDIRIVYAMFGNEVLRILRQEAGTRIPMTHLAWDRDEDGIYDRYVHMKSLAISGVYGKKTNAMITVNGSANWTPVSLASDEVIGVFNSPITTRAYIKWIDFLFTHRPTAWGSDQIGQAGDGGVERRRSRGLVVDPYALIKQEL